MDCGTPDSLPGSHRPGIRASRGAGGRALPLLLLALAVAACEVEWGGASLELEEPPRPGPAAEAEEPAPEGPEREAAERASLPDAPLLYLVRATPGGRARAVPAARLGAGGISPLGWPGPAEPGYRARFDSAFAAAGARLAYHSAGSRAGTVVLTGDRATVDEACPSVVEGVLLVPPGTEPPDLAAALGPGNAGVPRPTDRPTLGRRGRLFGPILAERILRDAGYERAYLARQARLEAVSFPGDTVPGIAATYLVNDSLRAAPPPSGPSISLVYLARYEAARGYVPVWSAIRRYSGAEGREVYAHVDWIRVPDGRLHLLQRYGSEGVRLAGLLLPDGEGARAELRTAGGPCPVFDALSE